MPRFVKTYAFTVGCFCFTQVFDGNRDDSDAGEKKNSFDPPITARAIRIWPVKIPTPPPCLRVELYGCVPSEGELL